jgi:hypothetical protein
MTELAGFTPLADLLTSYKEVYPEKQNRFTQIWTRDEPGPGGAHHNYVVSIRGNYHVIFADVAFQKGSVKEMPQNGVFMEDLLSICRHRLECFQAGEYACPENAEALDHIMKALEALDKRTKGRQTRGVEGASEK